MQTTEQQELIRKLNHDSYTFEHTLDPVLRRRTGSYYTSLELTLPMMRELIAYLPPEKQQNIHKLRFLEPCVGTGNFVFAYILAAAEKLKKHQVAELFNNIYACDINQQALKQYRAQLRDFAAVHYGIVLGDDYFAHHVGGGLLFDVTHDDPRYIPLEAVFGVSAPRSFDVVVTNPPYKNLKAEAVHYPSAQAKAIDKAKYDAIARQAKKVLPLTAIGTLNIYKLFVEEILTTYAAQDALVSLLVPTSLLTDKTCQNMRAVLIKDHHIVSIKNIPENNRFIDAQQALSAILIDKTRPSTHAVTMICKTYAGQDDETIGVQLSELATPANGYAIVALGQQELRILQKMTGHPRIKELPFITNARGELDLTLHKTRICTQPTPYRLLRGRNIQYYHTDTTATEGAEYVQPAFVQASAKKTAIYGERLACQQVSNAAKARRLVFAKVAPQSVLANSCNFVTVTANTYDIDTNYLLGLLNAKVMDWFFKLHSSNNHVNNYEIDNLPIPVQGAAIATISRLVAAADGQPDPQTLDAIDGLVNELFGITDVKPKPLEQARPVESSAAGIDRALHDMRTILPQLPEARCKGLVTGSETLESVLLQNGPALSAFDKKVLEGLVAKHQKLHHGMILNHTTFKLSDLDMEMIRPIPQGGNWKDIPAETVGKSRRLTRITETGGRTTLYGRLHYDRPSYTITTYFNRPGNGTYVHPRHDRVLSVREAARFQAFPDDYYFYGNKTQLLKQIGNAVPTLLAYQIGRKIVAALGPVSSVDLFCGAGGLTNGFARAGITTVVCTDFDLASCVTIQVNNPQTTVIHGDITDAHIKDMVVDQARQANVDIVCGGPPCQGFSMAGYRNQDDPRNQLFKEFVAVVDKVRPKVVLFENVEGILTFMGGETYKAIHELFAEMGYQTEGRLLKIDRYGVPQKRKRVIIICTRNDLQIMPADLYPDESTVSDDSKITVADSIGDLEDVACSETARYAMAPAVQSHYGRLLSGAMSPETYFKLLNTKATTTMPFVQAELPLADAAN